MKSSYLLLGILIFISSCTPKRIDVNGMSIPEDLLDELIVEIGYPYELFTIRNRVFDPNDTSDYHYIESIQNGLIFHKIPKLKAFRIYNKLRKEPALNNQYTFLSEVSFNSKGNLLYSLNVIEANDQFQALKIIRPEGLTERFTSIEIYKTLIDLHQKNSLEIYLIDKNRIHLYLSREPDLEFISKLEEVCNNVNYFKNELEMYWK